MTISRSINAAVLSNDMTDFEDGARAAPAGAYEDAKALSQIFSEVYVFLKDKLAEADIGVTLPNNDRYREFEAVMYGMLREGNPDCTMFPATEGFGRALAGPAGARVMAQTEANLAFFRERGLLPQAGVHFG